MLNHESHMRICDLFNEVLGDLEGQYRGSNFEYGVRNLVKGRGIKEGERQQIHAYRVRLNDLLRSIKGE